MELQKRVFGKPHAATYAFAEKRLEEHRPKIVGRVGAASTLGRVYMVGGESRDPSGRAREPRAQELHARGHRD